MIPLYPAKLCAVRTESRMCVEVLAPSNGMHLFQVGVNSYQSILDLLDLFWMVILFDRKDPFRICGMYIEIRKPILRILGNNWSCFLGRRVKIEYHLRLKIREDQVSITVSSGKRGSTVFIDLSQGAVISREYVFRNSIAILDDHASTVLVGTNL